MRPEALSSARSASRSPAATTASRHTAALLTPSGINNATALSSAAPGALTKTQVTLPTPLRVVGMPPWRSVKASFGSSMVVKTLSDGAVLMTFCVAWHGEVWPHMKSQPRASILAARATDG